MVEPGGGRGEGISPSDGTGRAPDNWAARYDLLLFFVLAYLLSWALWPLVILNPTSSPLVPFGPLIAAVIVSLLAGGPKELWALLRQLTRWRVHPIWYLIALLGPFVMAVVAAALAVATGAPMRRSGAYTDWVRSASPCCQRWSSSGSSRRWAGAVSPSPGCSVASTPSGPRCCLVSSGLSGICLS